MHVARNASLPPFRLPPMSTLLTPHHTRRAKKRAGRAFTKRVRGQQRTIPSSRVTTLFWKTETEREREGKREREKNERAGGGNERRQKSVTATPTRRGRGGTARRRKRIQTRRSVANIFIEKKGKRRGGERWSRAENHGFTLSESVQPQTCTLHTPRTRRDK